MCFVPRTLAPKLGLSVAEAESYVLSLASQAQLAARVEVGEGKVQVANSFPSLYVWVKGWGVRQKRAALALCRVLVSVYDLCVLLYMTCLGSYAQVMEKTTPIAQRTANITSALERREERLAK